MNDIEKIEARRDSLATEIIGELKEQSKRWFRAFIIVLLLWAATIAGFIWYLNQYDFVSYQYDVNAEDGGNANYIGNNGDINNYGTSESK